MELEHAADSSDVTLDRLSDLPDCLLHGILSLSSMGVRRLVQTSTLSRRWRHLWRDALCLDVGLQEFQGDDDIEKWVRFNDFTDSLITQHSTLDLHTLRMQVVEPPKDQSGRWSKPDGNSWVRRCLSHYSPAMLDIQNHSSNAHVQLRRMSRGTVLRRLTRLRLNGVTLCAGFEQLLGAAGCPQLEHLELRDCLIGFREVVASPTLKTLVVDISNMSMDQSSLGMCYTPRIVGPGLASLHLVLLTSYPPLWEFEMPSLVEATVRTDRGWINGEFDLLCSLHNVTKLEISTFPSLDMVPCVVNFSPASLWIRHPYRSDINFPEFHNNLTRDAPTLLEFFLFLAPNLEKLTLQNCRLPPCSERMVERSVSMKMCDYHLNLRFVEIKYRTKDGVCGIIKYLLRVAKNLQRTDVLLSEGPEKPWYVAACLAQGWYENEFGHLVPRPRV